MASVNKVILVGNLGRDPEVRYTATGTACANFSIATTYKYKDASGERQEETEWHRLVAFGKTGELVGEYLRKGSAVYIEGRLRTKKWTDKDGVEKYTTEVIVDNMQFLTPRSGDDRGTTPSKPSPKPAPKAAMAPMDDDIPF